MREEAWAEADTLYDRWFGAVPAAGSEPPLHERAVMAHVRSDSIMLRRVLEEAPTAPGRRPGLAALAVARYFGEMDVAERLARAGLKSSRTPDLLAFHYRALGELALARGRRAEAGGLLQQAEQHSMAARTQRVLCAVAPFLPPSNELHALTRTVTHDGAIAVGTELERALAQHVHYHLLGLLSSAAGNYEAAEKYASQLEQLPAPLAVARVTRALAQTVRGDIAWRRGRFAEAIEALEAVDGQIPSDLLNSSAFAQEHARYVRADSYLRLGNHEQALRWFAHGFQGTPSEVIYMAPVHLRLAEIHDARSDTALAARHYATALTLWNGADPELSALLSRARKRLHELRAS